MKKVLVFSMILFLASGINVKAQTDKGRFFMAGSYRLGLNFGVEKQKSGSTVVTGTENSYFNFDYMNRLGYTVIDNLVTGLVIDLQFYNNKYKDDSYFYKSTTFIIGPFVRYYIPITGSLKPYAEGQVGFGLDNSKYRYNTTDSWTKTNESVFTYQLGAGVTYFFNDYVGADLFLGYLHDSYKLKDTSTPERSSDSKYIYNEFIMQLGLVVLIDH
jgi:hypothetical protein